MCEGNVQCKVYYTKDSSWCEAWLNQLDSAIAYHNVEYANFTNEMMLAVVALDKDNCAYVLVPKSYLEESGCWHSGRHTEVKLDALIETIRRS